jgi:hypothetical protein
MNIIRHHHLITSLCTGAGNVARAVRAQKSTSTGMLTALAVTVTLIGAAPAFAAKGTGGGGAAPPPVTPPVTQALPPDAIVFTMRDFVSMSNLLPNADLIINSVRNNVVNGTANAKTNASGFVEVNHPGGVCWDKVTPDISANDLIQVTYKSPPSGTPALATQTLTQNVTATQAAIVGPVGSTYVEIKGTAQLASGAPIDLSLMEVRIINPAFIDPTISRIGKRDIRADSTGGRIDDKNGKPISGTSGRLVYDTTNNPGGLNFTATFLGLTPAEQQLVVEGQTRIMAWAATDTAGNRLGVTIYEVGEFGGPGMGNCPPGPGGAVAPTPLPTNLVHYDPSQLTDAKVALPIPVLTAFPDRDFVSITGLAPGADIQLVVRRPSIPATPVIGAARGIVGSSGVFEVNHPGGICWSGQTPDIGANDYIDMVIIAANGSVSGQTQRVINTSVTKPATISSNQVVVTGTAFDELGDILPLGQVEQRIINPDFTTTPIGRRDITADINGGRVAGGTGLIGPYTAGCAPGCVWKAAYTFAPDVAAVEQNIAVAGQSRSLAWLNTFNGTRSGITISEYGELGGPGMGNCPARGNASTAMP